MGLNPDKLSYHKGASGNKLSLVDFANWESNPWSYHIEVMNSLPKTDSKCFHDEYMCKPPVYDHVPEHMPPRIVQAPRLGGKSRMQEMMLEAIRNGRKVNVESSPKRIFVSDAMLDSMNSLFANSGKSREQVVPTLKEKQMSRFNVETLMALANIKNDDEFAKYDALPANLQEVLKRKLKEQEEKRLEDAADSIVHILNSTEDAIAARVDRIRELRRSVERLKAEIGEIERAKAFGMETQNFVPLAAGLGMVSLMTKGAVIPAEWTAKTATKKAVVKK